MIKKKAPLEATLSLIIGFLCRGYIIAGAVWFCLVLPQGKAFEWINGITPIAGIIPGLMLLLFRVLLNRILYKIRDIKAGTKTNIRAINIVLSLEMKQKSFRIQATILLIIAVFGIALGTSLEVSCKWPISLIAMACLSYFGIMFSKLSGARTDQSGEEAVKRTGAAILSIGLACGAGILLIEPVSAGLRWAAGKAAFVFKWIWSIVEEFFRLLFSLFHPGEAVEQAAEYPIEEFRIPEFEYRETSEIAQIIVMGTALLIAAVVIGCAVVLLVKYLIRLSMRKRQAGIDGTAVEIQSIKFKGFFRRIADYFSRKAREIRAKWILANHPGSIGSVLNKVEKRVRKRPKLRRQYGETVREFFEKLKQNYRGKKSEIFDRFSDACDRAVYSGEKSWLVDFPEAKELLKEVNKNL